jgi:hypothetical protein
MKLATYYRTRGDDVRFWKGDLKLFAARLLCEEFLGRCEGIRLGKHVPSLIAYIRTGKYAYLESIPGFMGSELQGLLKEYRIRYQKEQFPLFDIVAVTTLFTFYWKKTIETINYAKKFCSSSGEVIVGGIAATILREKVHEETGIMPHCGLLDRPGILDGDTDVIVDELPLDYSILEEIDYEYPAKDCYLAYMTRGCPRTCRFCAVPKLEPEFKHYVSIRQQIETTDERYGPKRDLLLMDNNVLASEQFERIVEEIKECGFARGARYIPSSEYDIALKNLADGYNVRAFTRKIIKLYDLLALRLPEHEQARFYLEREARGLLYVEDAEPNEIINFDSFVRPLYERHFKRVERMRIIDFNQGVDARLLNEGTMEKLAELNIRPLRIAFDHYGMRDVYDRAIRMAVKYGITDLSNYLLYNFEDTPDDLYHRMKLNVDLCDELDVTIYSFPMKYHPIDDPRYFGNRDYIGKHWNRKFIRAIQAVLNATKGKIGRGKEFFEEAFGASLDEFHKILWMPEAFIIHRLKYKDNLTVEWWEKYQGLSSSQKRVLHMIVGKSTTKAFLTKSGDQAVDDVLSYYRIQRD